MAVLIFDEEEVELDLSAAASPGPGKMIVRASYWFRNPGQVPWKGRIVYPIWVSDRQAAPPHIVLSDGKPHKVRCLLPDACAATFDIVVPPRSRREVWLRYEQPLPSRFGPAVYLLTTGATWSHPIGRARLRVLVPGNLTIQSSYPLNHLGDFEREGKSLAVYGYETERFAPAEELRVMLRMRKRKKRSTGEATAGHAACRGEQSGL